MSDKVIDSADLGFLVKMVKDGVIKQVSIAEEHLFKAFDTDLSAMPAIFVCCSEYVADEKFANGSIVIAVLGGATYLSRDDRLMNNDCVVVAAFLQFQVEAAQKEHADFPIILIVDVPCIALDTGPLDVVQQIRDMISGLEASDLAVKTDVSCYLRINTSAGGSYYKIDKGLWAKWYRNYEVNVLGHEDDPDPGAAEPTEADLLAAIENSEACPDDMMTDEDNAPDEGLDGAMEAYRESQHETSDDPSHRKG